ncbi:MAG: M48 family metallopeptidase, partial [Clostridia bacterium]|nr:M48 family metallopeptidase [Clostridia bacterium]
PVWERKTGLFCDTWHIKNMKTRWGTCNPKARRVWLNLQLARKPEECLEYVILHELAHLKIPGHGRDFEAFLDRYMPDWREIRARLNDRA